jgi:hypothetical protein
LALSGCEKKRPAPAVDAGVGLRSNLDVPPSPPVLKESGEDAGPEAPPPKLRAAPTRGRESPEALAAALVEAAEKRDVDAFLDLVLSTRDIALYFHPGVQPDIRRNIGELPRKFQAYAKEIPPGFHFAGWKRGLQIDFRGQGAKAAMRGFLKSEAQVKKDGVTKSFPMERIVRIEGRWKILDL